MVSDVVCPWWISSSQALSSKPSFMSFSHSDRGAQYTSHRFKQLLHEHAVVQSFSNSGRPHDNAVAESFFATLKKEELYRKDYTSETDFKRCLASYIEFYNTQRPHRTLKNRTPCQVEELFMNGKWGEQLTDITGVRISSITRFVFWFYPVCIFQVTQDMKYRKAWTPCNARGSYLK